MWPEILETLATERHTLATAESLTGGLLASSVAAVPGASHSFLGGVVCYSTAVKQDLLGVSDDVVAEHGVVSQACAAAMADGVRALLHATWGVATTGVAGPDAQEDKPVGTVWIAVSGPGGVTTRGVSLTGDRGAIRERACVEAMSLLGGILEREHGALG